MQGGNRRPERRRKTNNIKCLCIHSYLVEPQTTIYKWLFQLDDSQSLHDIKSLCQVLPSDPFGGVLNDLFRGENVTSIWGIKRSRLEEAGVYIIYI